MNSLYNNYCCVCLSKYCFTEISQCDTNNVTIISKLQSIVSEVEWKNEFKICLECLARLSSITNIEEFKNLCIQTDLIRRDDKINIEMPNTLINNVGVTANVNNTNDYLLNYKYYQNSTPQGGPSSNNCPSPVAMDLKGHLLDSGVIKKEDINGQGPPLPITNITNNMLQTTHNNPSNLRPSWYDETKDILGAIGAAAAVAAAHGVGNMGLPHEHLNKVHHEMSNIKTEWVSCEYCFLVFNGKELCAAHVKQEHMGAPLPLKKELDPSSSSADESMEQNLKPKRNYSCEVCNQIFPLVKDVVEHCKTEHNMNEGQTIRPYSCSQCPARYTRPDHLNIHFKKHGTQRDFKCEICNADFHTKNTLDAHIVRLHTDPSKWSFHCELCDKRFSTKGEFSIHMNRHKGVHDFQCHICQRGFVRKCELDRHLKIHSDVPQAYKCSECTNEYKDKHYLVLHLRKKHGGIGSAMLTNSRPTKEYACHLCHKTYTQKNSLNTHLNIHSGLKPYSCTMCDRKFNDKSNMRKHIKQKHKMFTAQPPQNQGPTKELMTRDLLSPTEQAAAAALMHAQRGLLAAAAASSSHQS